MISFFSKATIPRAFLLFIYPPGFLGAEESALKKQNDRFISNFEAYKLNYFLFARKIEEEKNNLFPGYDDKEIKLRFSLKKRLLKAFPFYFGYNHKAFWQVFDEENSRPIRENNYNPEFFLYFEKIPYVSFLQVGLWEHESNGETKRVGPHGEIVNYSRSWNRMYLLPAISFLESRLSLALKLWLVIDNDRTSYHEDNPDIKNYLGNGEFYLKFLGDAQSLDFMFRRGFKEGTETVQLDYRLALTAISNLFDEGIYIHLHAFKGYGESLLSYNQERQTYAIGFSFN